MSESIVKVLPRARMFVFVDGEQHILEEDAVAEVPASVAEELVVLHNRARYFHAADVPKGVPVYAAATDAQIKLAAQRVKARARIKESA